MSRALFLASMARGRTSPNPMVGAVIVKSGRIIAEGYHEKAGKDHAEIVALKKARGSAKKATMYITLEPCCHHGRTPPCTDAIIAAGLDKVVVAATDPNPLVGGKGIAQLKAAGINVQLGLLQKEANKLNEAFNKWIVHKVPFLTLKAALSLDGRLAAADGSSKWITSDEARKRVHEMRAENDAVLVGIKTVLNDNPRLNVRMLKRTGIRHPIRVVVDSRLETPVSAAIFHSMGGKVWIATISDDAKKSKALENEGATIIRVPEKNKRIDLKELMAELGRRGIVSLMVEGGAEIHSSMLTEGMVDKLSLFYAPILLGGGARYSFFSKGGASTITDALKVHGTAIATMDKSNVTVFDGNIMVEGYLN